MAIILSPENEAKWLDPNLQTPEELFPLLETYSDQNMEAFAVSTKINTPVYDAADCIVPIEFTIEPHLPAPRESSDAQRSLF